MTGKPLTIQCCYVTDGFPYQVSEPQVVMSCHLMFTMPEELWEIFLRHRELLKNLMDMSSELLQEWFKDREKVEIGMMVGLHTFGATMNFNPHVHVLITEGGLTKDGKMKHVGFIPYEMMRNGVYSKNNKAYSG